MPDFTHGDKPMPSGWKPPGYDYRSQQQGNDLAASDRIPELPADSINEPTSARPSPSKGLVKATTDAANPPEAIEGKLNTTLFELAQLVGENSSIYKNLQRNILAIITTETTKAYQRGYNTGWVRRNRAEPFPQTAPAKMQVDKSKLNAPSTGREHD